MSGRRLALLALCAIVMIGCEKKTNVIAPVIPGKGSLVVTVRNQFSALVRGALVLTNPQTARGNTDTFGQILIEDMPPGVYTIIATHPSEGSAQDVVQVESDKLVRMTMVLNPGILLTPQVRILSPVNGSELSYVDSVGLSGSVMDIEDEASSLALSWRSSVDGELSSAPADANGLTFVRRGPLSIATHRLVLTARDSDGFVGADSVVIAVRSFPPQVAITHPLGTSGFVPGEPIIFRATVSDRETPATNLEVEWRSNLDGVLSQAAPAADGVAQFTTSTLSRGVHEITLLVRDTDNNETQEGVTVANNLPQRVVLNPLQTEASSLILTWAPPNEPGFAAYRIHRATSASGPFSIIGILSDPNAGEYRDRELMLGRTYWYRVGLLTTGGSESLSNIQNGSAGVFINVATQVEALIADPIRPYLYAADRVNNSLLFIHVDSLRVTKTIFIGSRPTDLDIDASGNELFVANYGSSQIAAVNLDSQTLARSLIVDTGGIWEGNPYRLVCATAGRLVWTSFDQWNSLKLIDTQTGARLHDIASVYQPDLAASPDGSRIYVGESGSSGSKVYRFDIVNDQLQQVDQLPGYGYGYSLRLITLSGDGAYVFYAGKKILGNSLGSELGTFPENVYLSNQTGSVVVGETGLFDGNTFAQLRALPIAGTIKALSPDGNILYSYDGATSRIYLVDVTTGTLTQQRRIP